MKESHRRTLGILGSGLIKIAKIIFIIIKSFFEAITLDFYHNLKKYWKKDLKQSPELPKTPTPSKTLETPKPGQKSEPLP